MYPLCIISSLLVGWVSNSDSHCTRYCITSKWAKNHAKICFLCCWSISLITSSSLFCSALIMKIKQIYHTASFHWHSLGMGKIGIGTDFHQWCTSKKKIRFQSSPFLPKQFSNVHTRFCAHFCFSKHKPRYTNGGGKLFCRSLHS